MINFFQPTKVSGYKSDNSPDAYIYVANKGKLRKGADRTFSIRSFLYRINEKWKSVSVGQLPDGRLCICQGKESNGYNLIYPNTLVSNTELVTKLVNILGYKMPDRPDETLRIFFKLTFDREYKVFILNKIEEPKQQIQMKFL